jgi:hypothetical protein
MVNACNIFGVLDLFAVFTLILMHYDYAPLRLALAFSIYLIFKLLLFHNSFHSYIDAAIGVYMLILLLGLNSVLTYFAAGYLLQKAIFSLMS